MKKIIFTNEDTEKILNFYNEGMTQEKIAQYFNVSRHVIKNVLLNYNIQLRARTTKYTANYDIFETIDTPEKAYWLGFIAADGCNYWREKNASVIISIHQKDIEHLKKFQSFCNSNAQIKTFMQTWGYSNNTPMCKIVLNSKKMSQDLTDKGVMPNKSLILKPPKIDEQFFLPFILGYFDGDGSIYKTSQDNNFSISFVGTKEILEWINQVLNLNLTLEQRIQNNLKNNCYIRCGGTNKPYNVMKQLYNSCNVHLDRKYQIFQNLETVVLNRNIK